eukprot:2597717-Rhodomonas_salina.8
MLHCRPYLRQPCPHVSGWFSTIASCQCVHQYHSRTPASAAVPPSHGSTGIRADETRRRIAD